ncbi:23S rRNA (uracil(1939)-C(5))-methyltransferase RlmD [Psychromonas sp. 14N.309.X.WAT.B.A12]|uniref:23S rRNA (uracil(1939)-C(5))-methyltransferase RlmD n=1 Tax=unclassified Psychromonas TaxID=2614957 RepID=UPI0025B1EA02|nr:23S rRNA (uracil(1939)-C(5))-methyltransferase RlmD [Psychromonas sp. 14N.309.X.WAT.B.A12]MDN2664168.1 23S rRNA (uracil(1939)-C(5))-methyltransferase RlmD [Psychromonas sp. 14N.309.X.WAT.B.A12]
MAQFFKASRTNKQNNRIIKHCQVDKLDHQGRGMLFHQNKPMFVEGGLIGEILDVCIDEDKKRYKKASIVKIQKASELRIEPNCQHYQECGGCHLQHIEQSSQVSIKQQGLIDLFERFAKYKPEQLAPTISSSPWAYRRCARFGVIYDKKSKKVQMGFRRSGSSELINQQTCPVLKPTLAHLIVPIKTLLNQLQGKMSLGHVEMVEADNTVAVLLRHLKPLSAQDKQLIVDFSASQNIQFYVQSSPTEIQCLTSDTRLSYSLTQQDCHYEFNINDFLQVNAEVNEKMVAQAIDWLALKPSDRVLDLFCGLGNFSLPIAKLSEQVVAVEGVQKMVDRGTANALQAELNNVQFFQADLSDLNALQADWAQGSYQKVLLDPARAGAAECMGFIINKQPTHIVYVSCDPVTLARDSEQLLSGGYKLSKLSLIDMFPQTAHMESMALFTKA